MYQLVSEHRSECSIEITARGLRPHAVISMMRNIYSASTGLLSLCGWIDKTTCTKAQIENLTALLLFASVLK